MEVIESSPPRLLEEIAERDPDIVGLEEVDDFAVEPLPTRLRRLPRPQAELAVPQDDGERRAGRKRRLREGRPF